MAKDKVNWELIEEFKKKEEFMAIWKPYGLPEITDPITSAFGDVVVQPPWDIPEKIVISAAITGAFYSPKTNPHHHVLPEDITASGLACAKAGAPTVHIHFRDENGYNVLDPALYNRYIPQLREQFPDVVYDGCMVPFQPGEWDKMIQVLDAGHLEVTPINTVAAYCGDTLFCKPPHVMIEKTRLCQERGVKCQIAVYSDGDIDNADRYLIKTGLLEKPYYWIILPTLPGGSPMQNPRQMVYNLMHLVGAIKDIDDESIIVVCAAGRASSYLATLALLLGLNIRVGKEDTVFKWPHKDDRIEDNAQQFLAYKTIAELLGRKVATGNEYREMIGLKPLDPVKTKAAAAKALAAFR